MRPLSCGHQGSCAEHGRVDLELPDGDLAGFQNKSGGGTHVPRKFEQVRVLKPRLFPKKEGVQDPKP